MRCKIMVGKKTLIGVQDVPKEISDMMMGLIRVKHPKARLVMV